MLYELRIPQRGINNPNKIHGVRELILANKVTDDRVADNHGLSTVALICLRQLMM